MALSAEEVDYSKEIAKLQSEAEARLNEKIDEMTKKIETDSK